MITVFSYAVSMLDNVKHTITMKLYSPLNILNFGVIEVKRRALITILIYNSFS